MRVLVALALAIGCGADPRPTDPRPTEPGAPVPELAAGTPSRSPWYESQPQPPEPARFRDPAAARYHMRAHFNDLRMIEQLLVAGKLDEGLALAYLLMRPPEDPGLAAWDDHGRAVREAATNLIHAPGLDEALRREARVAVACAGCHAATQSRVVFAAAPGLPPDRQTAPARMARHVWAVDRLWEGMVGPDDERWRRGLTVLADSPLPFTSRSDAPMLAAELQQRARTQLDTRGTTLLDDRGAAYGEMLVLCAACHATLHTKLP